MLEIRLAVFHPQPVIAAGDPLHPRNGAIGAGSGLAALGGVKQKADMPPTNV